MADFKIERGLQLDYDGMLTKDADTMYVCTDTGNMYLGSQRLCYFIPDWDASQGEEGYIDHRPFYSKNQTTLQSIVLGASQVDFDWDIAPILGAIYTVTISVGGVSTSYLLKVVGGPSQTTLKIDIPQYGILLYDSTSSFSNYNGRFSGNATVESVEILGEVIYPLDGKYVPDKVSKSGDTMTGALNMSESIKINFPSNGYETYFLQKLGANLSIGRTNGNGADLIIARAFLSGITVKALYITTGSATADNQVLKRSDGDNRWLQIAPPVSTTTTLVSGSFNELGTINYSTIALPATPGTAEYNGTFTSSTAGDIRNNTGLSSITKWQGDVTIEANATYSFCFQNGFGIVVKML